MHLLPKKFSFIRQNKEIKENLSALLQMLQQEMERHEMILSQLNEIKSTLEQQDNQLNRITDVIENHQNTQLHHLEDIIQATHDITTLPPAHGHLRLIQQSAVVLLKKLNDICRRHDLSFWMDYGSLLGTVRHQGFIPWDDDMDVSMLRSDYDRLLPILEKEFCKDGFHFSKGDIIRLFYKGIPAQVDIFPYDQATETEPPVMGTDEFTELYQWMENVHWHVFQPDYSKLDTQEDTITPEHFANGRLVFKDTFLKGQQALPNGYLFTGVETAPPQRAFFRYDWIFPLQKARFEGMDVLIPQKADLYLRQYYNDYMAFPRDCYPKHSSIMGRLNTQTILDMHELTRKDAQND